MTPHRTVALAFSIALALSCRAAPAAEPQPVALPTYRVEADGFDARELDLRAVFDSASRELWRYFPDYKIEPFVVTRGHDGPITLFKRNDRGEIVVRLDTEKTYWSQYSYQFAHEFCHILCGFRPAYQGNKWFEETVCETASLFVMRAMSRTWKTAPPYENWRDYRDALRDYSDEVLLRRQGAWEIYAHGLPAFYRAHRRSLETNPVDRELNGAMSVVLLRLFEEQPERWEAVRWLNATAPKPGDTFATYLQNWHDAAPEKHRAFVEKVAELYGMPMRAGRTAVKEPQKQ